MIQKHLTTCSAIYLNVQELQAIARANLIKAKERSKQYYDKRVHLKNFDIGDLVYLLSSTKTYKLDQEYNGPYVITNKLDNENFEIKIRNRAKLVHANLLKSAYVDESG